MESQREPKLRILDVLEVVAVLILPAIVFGVSVALLSGWGDLLAGLLVGGVFGAILARYRAWTYAVRTEDGIERRLRMDRADPEDNLWVRIANIEYDERYDRVLMVVLAVGGIGAFGAIPFVSDGLFIVRLALVGLIGITAAVMTYGIRKRSE